MPKFVYLLRPRREALFFAAGIALVGLAVYLDRRSKVPVFVADVKEKGEILPIDLLASTVRRPRTAKLADLGLYGGPAMPLLLTLHPRCRPHAWPMVVIWAETILLNFGLTSVVKNATSRPRPYIYDQNWQPELALTRNDRAAFLSGHASIAGAGCVLFLVYTRDMLFPGRSLTRVLALLLPLLTAFLRVRSGKHWPTDAIAGLLLGTAVGLRVPEAHREELSGA